MTMMGGSMNAWSGGGLDKTHSSVNDVTWMMMAPSLVSLRGGSRSASPWLWPWLWWR